MQPHIILYINSAVDIVSHVKAVAYDVLHVYACLIGESTDSQLPLLFGDKQESFVVEPYPWTMINSLLSLLLGINRGESSNIPPALQTALAKVFGIDLNQNQTILCIRNQVQLSNVNFACITEYAATEMVTSLKNHLDYGFISQEVNYYCQLLDVTRKTGKILTKRIGSSKEDRYSMLCKSASAYVNKEIRCARHTIHDCENAKESCTPGTRLANLKLKVVDLETKRDKLFRDVSANKEFASSKDFLDFAKGCLEYETRLETEIVNRFKFLDLFPEKASRKKKAKVVKKPKDNVEIPAAKQNSDRVDFIKKFIEETVAKLPEKDNHLSKIRRLVQINRDLQENVARTRPSVKLVTISPASNCHRSFIRIDKRTLCKLLTWNEGLKIWGERNGNGKELKGEYWDELVKGIEMDDALPYLFNPAELRRLSGNGKKVFCPTFTTNGIELHLSLESKSSAQGRMNKQKNAQIARLENAVKRKASLVSSSSAASASLPSSLPSSSDSKIDEKSKTKKRKTMEKLLADLSDPNAITIKAKEKAKIFIPTEGYFVGVDAGIRNPLMCVHSSLQYPAVEVSRKVFDHESGKNAKAHKSELMFKSRMASDPQFANAYNSRCSLNYATSNFDDIVLAARNRITTFPILYNFYGSIMFAADKFILKGNKEREYAKMKKVIFEHDVKYLVVGDATMPKGLKGTQNSFICEFLKYVEREKGKGTVIFVNENRSSVTDFHSGKFSFNPVRQESKKKKKLREEKERAAVEKAKNLVGAAAAEVVMLPALEVERLGVVGDANGGSGHFRKGWGGVGGEETKPYVARVTGLYQNSMPGFTSRMNRDVNGALNMVKIYNHLNANNGEMPWAFRSQVKLREVPGYVPKSCGYSYEAKGVGFDRSDRGE